MDNNVFTKDLRVMLTSDLWNDERETLYHKICDIDSALAGYYRQAIYIMESSPKPGEEKARFSIICHCFRELMNNLPDVLGDVKD